MPVIVGIGYAQEETPENESRAAKEVKFNFDFDCNDFEELSRGFTVNPRVN